MRALRRFTERDEAWFGPCKTLWSTSVTVASDVHIHAVRDTRAVDRLLQRRYYYAKYCIAHNSRMRPRQSIPLLYKLTERNLYLLLMHQSPAACDIARQLSANKHRQWICSHVSDDVLTLSRGASTCYYCCCSQCCELLALTTCH